MYARNGCPAARASEAMAADLARDVAAMARAARDDKDGHEGLIRQLEHLQPRIDGILARVNDDGSDQHANDLRRWVVVLVTRIAAAAHAEAPRGADVVELVGAAHAPQAVVGAFDELGNELERWAVCLEDLSQPTAYYLNDEDDDAPISIRAKVFGGRASAIAKALLDAKNPPEALRASSGRRRGFNDDARRSGQHDDARDGLPGETEKTCGLRLRRRGHRYFGYVGAVL